MRRYITFAVSFVLLISLFQVLSGLFLTFLYTPNINDAWEASANLAQDTVIRSRNSSFLVTLVISFLSASIAYFISRKGFSSNGRKNF